MRVLAIHALAWSTRRSFLQIDTPSECSCDCCDVIERRPAEVVNGAAVTCAPSKARGAECSDQCQTAQGDTVLAAAGDTMDVARFCFFECKPTKGYHAKVGTSCLALDAEERRALTDRSGNAIDPALIPEKKPEAAKTEDQEFVAKLKPSFVQLEALVSRETPTEQARKPVEAMASAAADQAMATKGDMQALRSAEVGKMPDEPAAPDLSMIADILADKAKSEEFAQEAGIEAGQAEASLIEGRKEALEGGVKAGKNAMEAVKAADVKGAEDIAKFRERFVNTPELKALAAAAKASEPYHLSMTRAQATVAQYTAKANADMAQAKSLQAEAAGLVAKANAAASKGDAQALYDQARAKAQEASEFAANAQNSFKTADQMNLDMPKYVGAAQSAAAKAAFDAMPAWQPAPPPAGLMGGFR